MLLAEAAPAAGGPLGQAGSRRLLDVPYLPQSEDLCGGAAIAMVLRYWGDRSVHAEDFAPLIDRSAAGIRTDVLTAAVSRRGWNALPHSAGGGASNQWIRDQVDQGRPVVALIQVAPDRYHYIVIVGWTGDRVVAHDPADAPFTILAVAEFERAWAAAGKWALLVLPSTTEPSIASPLPAPPSFEATSAPDACHSLIQNLVTMARAGELDEAGTGLSTATLLCPTSPAAWRELAGVRFLQSRWSEAAGFAERAAILAPADQAGWDLLATSRYLNREPAAALRAWNRLSRPTVDLLRTTGVSRTRHPVVAAIVAVQPGATLTPALFGRAARRLDELPSAAATRLQYRPLDDGRAELEAAVVERPTVPRGMVPIAVTAARALLHGELRIDAAAPTRSGELVSAGWRWDGARPRVALSVAVPALSGWPGVTTVEGSWERQTYAVPAVVVTERRHAGLRVADWASGWLRWSAGAALDRWGGERHTSASVGLDVRLLDDRVSLAGELAGWAPVGPGARFATARVSADWRSTADRRGGAWYATGGWTGATLSAPLDLWPGAGTGQARAPLLRAHPLLAKGVVTGEVLGRRLLHGSLEYQHPLWSTPAGALQFALFADSARAWRRIGTPAPSALHTDLGAGLRVALPGKGGTLRVDVARGLRDKRMTLSTGWQVSWPDHARGAR